MTTGNLLRGWSAASGARVWIHFRFETHELSTVNLNHHHRHHLFEDPLRSHSNCSFFFSWSCWFSHTSSFVFLLNQRGTAIWLGNWFRCGYFPTIMTSAKINENGFSVIIFHSENSFQQGAAVWLESWQ